ncbi:MAG: PDZ domain-containing protein [Oscillospiraceae bacterium]
MSLGTRLMNAVVNVLTAILNIRIRFKYVLLAFIIFVGGAIGITYKHMLDLVGGKDDFDEAKRYIEIKDVVEEQYIDEVSRQTLGDYAAAAMVSGLADKWSYYISADEYKTYQLNSANEYSGIGMSIMKQDDGSFQVVSVNAGSPAGLAGLGAGDVITAVDGEDITNMSLDEARKLIRSKMNGKFTLGLGRKNSIEVDCSSAYQSAVNYRLEKTEAGYIQILNFEAGSGTTRSRQSRIFSIRGL